jgi:hypothetical protein
VHDPACGHDLVLAVLGQHHAEGQRVLEGPPHEAAVLDPGPVVGEQAHAEVGQLGHRRQLLTGPAHGDGPAHLDPAQRRRPEGHHLANHAGRVDRRSGVGHGHDRGEAAERRRPAAGLDRLGLLPSWLAQVGVEVDQPRPHPAAAAVEDPCPLLGQALAHRGHRTTGHEHVGPSGALAVDDRAALQEQRRRLLLPRLRHRGSRRWSR